MYNLKWLLLLTCRLLTAACVESSRNIAIVVNICDSDGTCFRDLRAQCEFVLCKCYRHVYGVPSSGWPAPITQPIGEQNAVTFRWQSHKKTRSRPSDYRTCLYKDNGVRSIFGRLPLLSLYLRTEYDMMMVHTYYILAYTRVYRRCYFWEDVLEIVAIKCNWTVSNDADPGSVMLMKLSLCINFTFVDVIVAVTRIQVKLMVKARKL